MAKINLSVIVPVYNTEKYVCQCLDSILGQTLENIEIICVNDGSTDSSLQLLEKYSRTDSRVRIISKANDGLGAARNTGIKAAVGDYIGFVDSDDFINSDYFQSLYECAIKNSADIVIGNVNLYFDDTGLEKPFRNCSEYERQYEGSFCAKQLPEIVLRIGVWDRIYRREFLKTNCLLNPEHVIYEDALFSFQTSVLAQRIALCPKAIYKYRKNTGVAITDKEIINDQYKFDFVNNGRLIKKFLSDLNVYEIYKPHFLKYFIENALWHQSNFMDYSHFRTFWINVLNIITDQGLLYIIRQNRYHWKSKVYAILLLVKYPGACYALFWRKRIKRKRRQKI